MMIFFTQLWYSFFTLGSTLDDGAFLDFPKMPKYQWNQPHFQFEFPKFEVISIELVNVSNTYIVCMLAYYAQRTMSRTQV